MRKRTSYYGTIILLLVYVIVNSTFPQALSITQCELTIWNPNSGINASVNSSGSIIFKVVQVHPANDCQYIEGQSGNHINWIFYTYDGVGFDPTMVNYTIYRNSTAIMQGNHYFVNNNWTLSINIDGLSEGVYKYTLELNQQGMNLGILDEVFVFVTPQNSDLILQSLAIGISFGSIGIIILVLVLSLRLKRNPVVEYVSTKE